MDKVKELMTKELKGAMDSKTLAGGKSIATADIKSIGYVTKFDVQTSEMPKSERQSDGSFKEIEDENGHKVMQSISFPTMTATVNGVAGSTIPAGAVLRGLKCIGALNETHLQNILEVYGGEPVDVEYDKTASSKTLLPVVKNEVKQTKEKPEKKNGKK